MPDIKFRKRKMIKYLSVSLVIEAAIMFLILNAINYNDLKEYVHIAVFVVLAITILLSYFSASELYNNVRYNVSDRRMVIRQGIFTLRSNNIDFDDVADIDTYQTMYERKNFLGTIEILAKNQTKSGRIKVYKMQFLSNFEEIENKLRELVYESRKH